MDLLDSNVVSELSKAARGTALARALTVVTRNTRDFERAGVEYVNPWSDG
jgi:hypothetical protein